LRDEARPPGPRWPMSKRVTAQPRRSNASAQARPARPPPTTATCGGGEAAEALAQRRRGSTARGDEANTPRRSKAQQARIAAPPQRCGTGVRICDTASGGAAAAASDVASQCGAPPSAPCVALRAAASALAAASPQRMAPPAAAAEAQPLKPPPAEEAASAAADTTAADDAGASLLRRFALSHASRASPLGSLPCRADPHAHRTPCGAPSFRTSPPGLLTLQACPSRSAGRLRPCRRWQGGEGGELRLLPLHEGWPLRHCLQRLGGVRGRAP
jgi:hypothetical protein